MTYAEIADALHRMGSRPQRSPRWTEKTIRDLIHRLRLIELR
jgi:hypothetical protein